MKALILAAGRGERLRPFTDEKPKPLISVFGLRLIEWVILSAREVGIEDYVVVTGYLGEKVRRFLGNGSRYDVKIKYVKNEFWRMGNGVSTYLARRLLNDSFIILMSDHIFNPEILFKLKVLRPGGKKCILCVDKGMNYVFDMEDATKVKIVDDKIVEIGKDLKEFNGVDMGIFLCSPYIFKVLKRNIEEGRYSLTDGVRDLARQGLMKAYPINNENYYWIDVDTFESLKIAEKILSIRASQTFDAYIEKLKIQLTSGKSVFEPNLRIAN